MKLIDVLKDLDGGYMFNDGAQTWDVPNIISEWSDDDLNQDVILEGLNIYQIDASDYKKSTPLLILEPIDYPVNLYAN